MRFSHGADIELGGRSKIVYDMRTNDHIIQVKFHSHIKQLNVTLKLRNARKSVRAMKQTVRKVYASRREGKIEYYLEFIK